MTDEQPESDIRRRAAYLLGMLVLFAALVVVLMVTFFNSSGGDPDKPDGIAGPSEPVGTSSSTAASRSPQPSSSASRSSTSSGPSSDPSGAPSTDGSEGPSSALPAGDKTCPADAPKNKVCALDGDVGNALGAINDYRASKGKSRVPGSISEEAQRCAVDNGSGCKGGWAETQVAKADGKLAVDKIQKFGKLLSDMKSIELGWAYDPGAKQYYFAIIRQD